MITLKTIKSGGNGFIKRMSIKLRNGSIKFHLILNDDMDEPHTHPWDFKSFLLIPYKEYVSLERKSFEQKDKIWKTYNHLPFTIVKRNHLQKHKVSLYNIFGIKIPAITIGVYSKKLQLCSFCQSLGYCKEQKSK